MQLLNEARLTQLVAITKFWHKHNQSINNEMAECGCTLRYKHRVSLLVSPPYTERTIASSTALLSLGINNGSHLQLFAFYANLISETNLFGMAVCAIDLKASVGTQRTKSKAVG